MPPHRVYSYVVTHDAGFAPNPFHGWCTLACCKPGIRATAQPGDLIFGLSRRCERIVYAFRVEERMTFAEYWHDSRFAPKRPRWEAPEFADRYGDNIYEPVGAGDFRQLRSAHWNHARDREGIFNKRRDLKPGVVVVGREFVYFGKDGPALPGELDFMHVTRGHRCKFTATEVARATAFFDAHSRGLLGSPAAWPSSQPDGCTLGGC